MAGGEARAQKALAAERDVALVRLAVVVANALTYLFLMDREGTVPGLAYATLAASLAYGGYVLATWRRAGRRILARSRATTVADAALVSLWIVATGGVESPFYLLWFGALAAVAYRFDERATAVAAGAYAGIYLTIVLLLGQVAGHVTELVVRVSYILFGGALATLLARESLAHVSEKLEMRDRMVAARTSEATFRSLLEAAPDAIVITDLEGRIQLVNSRTEGVFGYRRGELLGASLDRLLPDLNAVGGPERVPGTVVGVGVESHGRRRDGSEFPVEVSVSPLHMEEGVLVTNVVRDVTRRKEAEEALERLGRQNELILNSAGEGIFGLDLEGRLTFVNPAAARMLGWRVGDVLGEPLGAVLPHARSTGEPYAPGESPIFLAFSDGAVHPVADEVFRRADGTSFPVEYTSTPIRDERGTPLGAVVIFQDATERKRAEEERLASLERASELERLKELDGFKTQFMNMAAHELNTPLTPIKLQVHLLKRDRGDALGPESRKSLDILERNIERLAQLVQDVLDGARLQASRLAVRKDRVDLNQMVLEAVESFHEPAKRAGVALDARVAPDLVVVADAKRLTQVLFNLLSNALKFTPAGGRVTVETARRGDHALVSVCDTGAGLTPEQVGRLFRPFTQVHDTSQITRAGTGLGLYISKGIVDLHEGELWCDSDGPGRGTVFRFTLPLDATHDAGGAEEAGRAAA